MAHPDYKYYQSIFEGQPYPLAFVDLDLLEENAREILKRSKDKLIRVASKSVRCRSILERIFSISDQFQGIMCFSVPEAVFLSENGFDDLLMGYPAWHEGEIRMACGQIRKGKKIIFMVDEKAHVDRLNEIGKAENVSIPVCIDGDMSVSYPGLHFGVLRSGITDAASAVAVWEAIKAADFVELDGFMGYEAQIAGVGDKMPGQGLQNTVVKWLKSNSVKKIAKRRAEIVAAVEAAGGKFRVVNGGGTGSLESTTQEAVVTEVTVGSGFYTSHLFDYYSNFDHLPAVAYGVQIVRSPKDGVFTCHGGGYTASGAAGKEKLPVPYLPKGAELTANEGAGEVQTPIRYKGPLDLKIGDPIFLRHAKAGEICERFNELHLVSGGKITDRVPTYRGEGRCFL